MALSKRQHFFESIEEGGPLSLSATADAQTHTTSTAMPAAPITFLWQRAVPCERVVNGFSHLHPGH